MKITNSRQVRHTQKYSSEDIKMKDFEEQLKTIKSMGCLCSLNPTKINGVDLWYEDFGEQYDTDSENAEDYACGDMQFIPFEDVKVETLVKYSINEEQYRQIQKKLDCLSFGCCGWCV